MVDDSLYKGYLIILSHFILLCSRDLGTLIDRDRETKERCLVEEGCTIQMLWRTALLLQDDQIVSLLKRIPQPPCFSCRHEVICFSSFDEISTPKPKELCALGHRVLSSRAAHPDLPIFLIQVEREIAKVERDPEGNKGKLREVSGRID